MTEKQSKGVDMYCLSDALRELSEECQKSGLILCTKEQKSELTRGEMTATYLDYLMNMCSREKIKVAFETSHINTKLTVTVDDDFVEVDIDDYDGMFSVLRWAILIARDGIGKEELTEKNANSCPLGFNLIMGEPDKKKSKKKKKK